MNIKICARHAKMYVVGGTWITVKSESIDKLLLNENFSTELSSCDECDTNQEGKKMAILKSHEVPVVIAEWVKGVRGCVPKDNECKILSGTVPPEIKADELMLMMICYECCQGCEDKTCNRRVTTLLTRKNVIA